MEAAKKLGRGARLAAWTGRPVTDTFEGARRAARKGLLTFPTQAVT
jgi:hypothetical protein